MNTEIANNVKVRHYVVGKADEVFVGVEIVNLCVSSFLESVNSSLPVPQKVTLFEAKKI